MRGAVSTLAVRDYLTVRIETERFELRPQLCGRFDSSIGRKRCRPVLMVEPGIAPPCFARTRSLKYSASLRTSKICTSRRPSCSSRCGYVARISARGLSWKSEGANFSTFVTNFSPAARLEPAVEHSRLRMPRVFERPLPARRAHPGFVLIEHDGLAPGDSERRKNPLQLRIELGDAALGRIGMMKRKRIEMPRAAQDARRGNPWRAACR